MKMKTMLTIAVWSIPFLGRSPHAKEVKIYSHRQQFLIGSFLKAFTEETGIETKVLYFKMGLAQRLRNVERNSPADVVLTVDIVRLSTYNSMGMLAQITSEIFKKHIPAHLCSTDNTSFALSKRARVIATSKDRVAKGKPTHIEDLADPKWKERACTRSGSHVYDCARMASMIAHHGTEAAEEWANELVAYLARRPQENDRAQIKALLEGVWDVALINRYYDGKMKFSEESDQKAWAASINIVYPNQAEYDRDAHVNVSNGAVALYSKDKEVAVKLLEFLSEERSQQLYSETIFEYTVKPRVNLMEGLASWGAFKEYQLLIEMIAKLSRKAPMMIDRVG